MKKEYNKIDVLRFSSNEEEREFRDAYPLLYQFLLETKEELALNSFSFEDSCTFLSEVYTRILDFKYKVEILFGYYMLNEEILVPHNLLKIENVYFFDPSNEQFGQHINITKRLDNKSFCSFVPIDSSYIFRQRDLSSKVCSVYRFTPLLNKWFDSFISLFIFMEEHDIQYNSILSRE